MSKKFILLDNKNVKKHIEAVYLTCIFLLMNNNKFWFFALYVFLHRLFDKNDILCYRHTKTRNLTSILDNICSVIHQSHKLFTTLTTMVYKSKLYYKLFKQSLQLKPL